MRSKKTSGKAKLVIGTQRLIKESQSAKIVLTETMTHEFYLTEVDKITYSKATDDKNTILKVVNVSYEIRIKGS